MKANIVASTEMVEAVRNNMTSIADWFDVPPKVSLIQGDFVANDPATWPAVAATVAALNGTAATPWEVMYDSVEGNFKLVAPEPVGGWDFVSSGAGDSITGFKVVNAADVDTHIGATKFASPIPLVASGQHIMLPYVAIPLADLFANVEQPYDMA